MLVLPIHKLLLLNRMEILSNQIPLWIVYKNYEDKLMLRLLVKDKGNKNTSVGDDYPTKASCHDFV